MRKLSLDEFPVIGRSAIEQILFEDHLWLYQSDADYHRRTIYGHRKGHTWWND